MSRSSHESGRTRSRCLGAAAASNDRELPFVAPVRLPLVEATLSGGTSASFVAGKRSSGGPAANVSSSQSGRKAPRYFGRRKKPRRNAALTLRACRCRGPSRQPSRLCCSSRLHRRSSNPRASGGTHADRTMVGPVLMMTCLVMTCGCKCERA
jgi:hypothetical protein